MKLIMFDMDGTLYRTETSFFPAVQEFAANHAFAAPDEEFLRSFIGQSGIQWRAWVEQLHLGQPVNELLEEFDSLEERFVKEKGRLYEGAVDMLRGLVSDGWRLGICSNAPAWYPELILTGAGVRDLFAVIRVPRRPEETKSMMLCEVWNELHPEQCVMVGDRADDMRAAHAAGFLAMGAAYGWAPDELDHAEVCIHDITEVPMALVGRGAVAKETQEVVVPVVVEPEKPPEVVPDLAPSPEPNAAPELTADAPAVAEPVAATEPATETPAKPASETTPEPLPEPPVIQKPAAPLQQPAPSATPPSVPSVPEPLKQPEPAQVARRSWNLFRRRDERSR